MIAHTLDGVRDVARACAIFVGIVLLGCSVAAHGQQSPSDKSVLPGDAGASTTAEVEPPASDAAMGNALAVSRLFEILENNPEAMVEVKTLVADQAPPQEIPLQADSLTDEQVYAAIESSRKLRVKLTQFLRARGYVTEEEIEEDQAKQTDTCSSGVVLERDRPGPALLPGLRERVPESAATSSGEEDADALPDEHMKSPGKEHDHQEHATRPPNLTDPPPALHRTTPYNLLSLRDLYTQVPDSPQQLKRFGSDLFVSRSALAGEPTRSRSATAAALDVPLGPDYVLGPGDELCITLWGGVSMNLSRIIDSQGSVILPEAGPLQAAGLTMAKAQELIAQTLQAQYRNVQVAVTISRLRTVRIFVVGDVQRPGAYELSPLASPISALFAAGGPTAVGSLRTVRHYRNKQLIDEIDLYDFMLHGVRSSDERLQGGDTILIPPVGPQVALFGAVKRPAIYELKDETSLADVLQDAGGVTVAAALTHVTINRVVANDHREEITISDGTSEPSSTIAARIQATEVHDGDRVQIAAVLPWDERAVYLQGHIARPGKIAYRDGLLLNDVLRSYRDLLPEPADHGEIVRLTPPDLHPETIEFNLPDVLIGNTRVALQPFDTIRVFSRYEFDTPTVSVRGEVQRPGTYPLFAGMTAAQLVRAAGGFKRDSLLTHADLASYDAGETNVSIHRRDVAIGDAVTKSNSDSDVALKPGDILTVLQLTGWSDIGSSIIVEGEVSHPGSYGFEEGEHLSDVLRRAGGFRPGAYPEGAVLTRPEVARLEEKSRQELIRQIETSSSAARMSPVAAGADQGAALQVIWQQQDQLVAQLRQQPARGRLVIQIDADINKWAATPADIEVRSGDVLRIPKRPGFVLVTGQVYNTSAIAFVPHKTAGWYLERAGGATRIANRKDIFVIRANGAVVGRRSAGWMGNDVLAARLNPGDTIVVPQKIISTSILWRNVLSSAQIAASLAIAAAVAGL